MRNWRKTYPHLDEERVTARPPRLVARPRGRTPRSASGSASYDGAPQDPEPAGSSPGRCVPLVQLPPAGHWGDTTRAPSFVLDPRPLPDPADAAALVLTRYLEAFGPASRRDVAAWSGVAQRDFPWERVPTVSYRDEKGVELLDLPGLDLPPADTPLPPRFLAHWDQPLLAYADRDRIIPPEVQPLKLTLSGDCTVTYDGRVAASWTIDGPRLTITQHTDFPRAAVHEEALRTARFCAPESTGHTVEWA